MWMASRWYEAEEKRTKGRYGMYTNVWELLCMWGKQAALGGLNFFLYRQDGESMFPVSLGQHAQRRNSVGCLERRRGGKGHGKASGIRLRREWQQKQKKLGRIRFCHKHINTFHDMQHRAWGNRSVFITVWLHSGLRNLWWGNGRWGKEAEQHDCLSPDRRVITSTSAACGRPGPKEWVVIWGRGARFNEWMQFWRDKEKQRWKSREKKNRRRRKLEKLLSDLSLRKQWRDMEEDIC